MDPSIPPRPLTFAERAAPWRPMTRDEEAAIREEMRLDAEWTATLVAKYGHPFDGLPVWDADQDDEPDAA